MQNASKLNLQQIQQFLHPSEEIRFKGKGRAEIYAWVARTLRQHGYSRQNRAAKGLLRQYLVKMTGLSRAQITRLIQQYRQGGELQPARYRRHRFARKYTPAEALLHDSTAARVGALFQLLVQDTTAQDFGLPSSAIRLRM